MARLARVIAPDTPHHVTQRGNGRQFIFECDTDRAVYLQLLAQYSRLHRLAVAGYCLMSNHVHLIVVPERIESLALALKYTHGRYAAYFNARRGRSGHLWQGRYYSCPMDTAHFWTALRYVERNPVRAGLAAAPEHYAWSSAPAHCGFGGGIGGGFGNILDLSLWRSAWTTESWREHVADTANEDRETGDIRRGTYSGRPIGTVEFVRKLEKQLRRSLAPGRGGRPVRDKQDAGQVALGFPLG